MYSIFQYSTPNDLHLSWQDETSSSTFLGGSWPSFFPADTWTHCCIVYNGEKVMIYRNGELYTTVNGISNRNNFEYDFPIVGSPIRRLNDVRIYDHTLSPLEVKHIAQGLILHYPLNRNGWGQENLLPCGGTYTQSSPWTTTLNRTDGYAFVTNSGFEATPGKTYTISVECDGNLYSAHGGTHNPSDKHWTFWAYISNINTTANWQNGGYDTPRNLTSSNNNYRKIGNTHVWTITLTDSQKYIGLRTNSYSNGTDNVTIKWWNMKVEEGDTFTGWSPNSSSELGELMNLNSTIEYDTSGYGNNGTRIGTFSWTSDCPKYLVSTYMSKSALITHPCPVFGGTNQEWTCAMWVKLDNVTQGQQAMNNFNISNNIVHSTTPLLYLNDGANDYYMYGSQAVSAGVWTHVAFVFKNSDGTRNVYINGVLKNNYGPNKTSIPKGIPNIVTVGTNLAGYISDYRVYATALSAEDIKSLYNNSAYIDNQGNIYGAVYEEV